jgi:hypothetical protein
VRAITLEPCQLRMRIVAILAAAGVVVGLAVAGGTAAHASDFGKAAPSPWPSRNHLLDQPGPGRRAVVRRHGD